MTPEIRHRINELRLEIDDLRFEQDRLKEQVEYWRNKCLTNQSTMDLVETVALGVKIECAACGKYKPCLCDK